MFYKQPQADKILLQHGRPTASILPKCFTVCIWNWQKSKQKPWGQEFKKAAAAADLFLAQEVRRSPQVLEIMEQTPYHWSGAVSFLSRHNSPTGVATGCVARPLKIAFKAGEREPFLRVPKMMLGSLIPLDGERALLVINIHAINFRGLKSFDTNLKHAAELLLNYSGPVLLGGDFNAWSLKRRRLLHQMARAAGLTEVPFEPDTRTRCLGRPVDYLFVRGLRVKAAGVRVTRGSDHNMLFARLEA